MNQIDLNGQVAVITGGAQGIGFAIAKRLVASGAKVSVWDMNAELLASAKAELAALLSEKGALERGMTRSGGSKAIDRISVRPGSSSRPQPHEPDCGAMVEKEPPHHPHFVG